MMSAIDRLAISGLVLLLMAICLLNLNGVGVMLLGINQLFSPLLLLSAFALAIIGFQQNVTLSRALLFYLMSLVAYLVIGGIAVLFTDNTLTSSVPGLLFRYSTGLLITLAGYYAVSCCYSVKIEPLKWLLIFAFVASFFIPFGHVLNVSGQIVVDNQRGAGLFGNPNEAGIIAAIGLAVTLVYVRQKSTALLLSTFFIVMAILTFSKAVLFMVFVIFMLNQLFKGRLSTSFVRLLILFLTVSLLLVIFRADIIALFDGTQAQRIEQFLNILAFVPETESVKSSRGDLWLLGLNEIANSPVIGNGLGALHSMQGATAAVNGGHAQGVHNSYLLKFGDAGIVAFVLFLAFVCYVFYQSFALAKKDLHARFSFFYFFIFSLDCMVTHNVELLRFHNFLLGLSLGFLCMAQRKQRLGLV
ncbi:O-antigen ligase family protein [Thalassotalea marina]|uniref:O-antigen ligase family protein n=1 Tax=Thalassotalea marina TaxID=1673741 RepID=A0A919BFN3_9GAMM|nr:O-antigen ligase family protein [Thalassotalea marina]GHF87842.1 hypothetical protein GCM10017161_14360 [Thalassotalea marina]